jgi:hypothetical protein
LSYWLATRYLAKHPDGNGQLGPGGTSNDYGWGITKDGYGNVYVTGHFFGPAITFGKITLTNAGINGTDDAFVVKLDSSGETIWAKSIGGPLSDGGQRIVADAVGNVFVIGDFNSPEIIFESDTLVKTDGQNIFIVRYDRSGNVVWARNAGQISVQNYGQGICVDGKDNLYVTGAFEMQTAFEDHILTNINPAQGDDIFITKYDSSGNVIWAKSVGGVSSDWCDAICTDVDGNLYVAGYFLSPEVSFDSTRLINIGGCDIFLAKYDASGRVVWAKNGSGFSGFYGQRISVDRNENVYLAGTFTSSNLIFDSIRMTNAGGPATDVFLAKFNNSGKILWAKSLGGDKNEEAFGLANDESGNIYMTGYFNSRTIRVGSNTLTNAGAGGDVFVIKYDDKGNNVWCEKIGGNSDDNGLSIAATKTHVYLAGDFKSDTIRFGDQTLTNAGNNYNFFVAQLKNK